MTAALGSLPFLATLWLLVVVGAKVLEESGAKIAAALKGKPAQLSPSASILRHRRPCGRGTIRGNVEWRAAA